jgi:hypothetical protein
MRQLVGSKTNAAIWSPSCPFHCNFYRGNDKVAKLTQVPMNSGYTLEVALRMFTLGLRDEKYNWLWFDDVLWPQNTPCAFFNIEDDDKSVLASCE